MADLYSYYQVLETIRVPLPEEIVTILSNDAKSFDLIKPSGKPNKNELYTRIIVNYSGEFRDRLSDITKDTIKMLNNNVLPADVLGEICEHIQFFALPLKSRKLNSSISIKPNGKSEGTINEITNDSSYGSNRTAFLRNMFAFYAMQPAEKREKIVFKEVYNNICEAMKNKQNIILTLNNKKTYPAVSPYDIVSSKEELHLYLLSQGVEDKKIYPTRLSKIHSVTILSKGKSDIAEENVAIFEKMKKHGPQFRYEPGENGAVIELTDIGKARYNSIYIHRPEPCNDVSDTNIYHFNCSHEQLFRYFSRFDEGFYVVEPESLRNRIIEFHKKAIEKSSESLGV